MKVTIYNEVAWSEDSLLKCVAACTYRSRAAGALKLQVRSDKMRDNPRWVSTDNPCAPVGTSDIVRRKTASASCDATRNL